MRLSPTPFLRRAPMHLREALRFSQNRPAIAFGLRAAVGLGLPFLAAPWVGAGSAVWMGIAGYLGTLADKGGAYATRARSVAGVALAGALSVSVAALVGPRAALAIPLMAAFATLGGLAHIYGSGAASAGASVAVLFAISLGLPVASPHLSLLRGAFVLGGGAWAMLLALLLWPVRVYRPARAAVGLSFRLLAAHAALLSPEGPASDDPEALGPSVAAIRRALEAARGVLAATRRGRSAETGRGARLLALAQLADQLLGSLVALEDLLLDERAFGADARKRGRESLAALSGALEELGEEVMTERPARLEPFNASSERLDPRLAPIFGRLFTRVETARELVEHLHTEAPLPAGSLQPAPEMPGRSWLEPMAENLTLESAELRHALRLGVASAAAVALTGALSLERGYWVTITVIILLQPYGAATWVKTLQRVVGTALGAMAAAALAAWVTDRSWAMALVLLLAATSAAVLQINYGLYALFLTPTFVLLAELGTHERRLAAVRVVNTLLGACVSLLASWVLWPPRERFRFPVSMAAALEAASRYLEEAVRALAAGVAHPPEALVAKRREFGLAILNAEASFQRLLTESARPAEAYEPLMTQLLYARRLVSTSAALAVSRHTGQGPDVAGRLLAFGEGARNALAELEAALREGRSPRPWTDLGPLVQGVGDALIRGRLERVALQLAILRDAVLRWSPHAGAAG